MNLLCSENNRDKIQKIRIQIPCSCTVKSLVIMQLVEMTLFYIITGEKKKSAPYNMRQLSAHFGRLQATARENLL